MAGNSGAIRAGRAFVSLYADNTRLGRDLRESVAMMKRFSNSARAVGASLVSAGLKMGAPFAIATAIFTGFEDQMAEVRAVTQASVGDFAALTDQAKQLGRTTSFMAKEVAGAQTELGRAGFDPSQIMAGTGAILDLARGTKTDLAQAAQIGADSLRAFRMEAEQMPRVADVLVATANNSSQGLIDLFEALKTVGPVAADVGASMEDTAAAIGVLANNGIKGTLAGNAMKRAYLNLANPTIRKKIQELTNVSAVDSAGNLRPLASVITDIGRATKGMPNAKKLDIFSQIFGDRAVVAASAFAGSAGNFTDLQGVLNDSAGTAARTAAIMDDTLGGSFRKLLSAAEGVAIEVGGVIAPAIRGLADIATEAAGSVTAFIKENRGLVIALAATAAGAIAGGATLIAVGGAVGVLAIGLGKVATELTVAVSTARKMGGLLRTLTGVGMAAKAVGIAVASSLAWLTAIATSPVALFGVLAAGIVTAGLYATGTLSMIGDGLRSLVTAGASAFRQVAAQAGTAWRAVSGVATRAFGQIVARISAGDMQGAFAVAMAAIGLMWAETVNAFSATWAPVKVALVNGWKATAQIFGDVFGGVVDFLKDTFGSFVDWFGGSGGAASMPKTMADAIAEVAELFATGWMMIKQVAADGVDVLADGWDSWISGLTNAWHSAIAFIQKGWTRLKALFDSDVNVEAEVADINRENKAHNDATTAAKDKKINDRAAARKAAKERSTAELGEQLSTIQQTRRAKNAEDAKAIADARAAAEAEAAARRAAFDAALADNAPIDAAATTGTPTAAAAAKTAPGVDPVTGKSATELVQEWKAAREERDKLKSELSGANRNKGINPNTGRTKKQIEKEYAAAGERVSVAIAGVSRASSSNESSGRGFGAPSATAAEQRAAAQSLAGIRTATTTTQAAKVAGAAGGLNRIEGRLGDSVGTFSSRAAGQMGAASSVMGRVAKAVEATASASETTATNTERTAAAVEDLATLEGE